MYTVVGKSHVDGVVKFGTKFVDKRRSLGWCNSFADSGDGVWFFFKWRMVV
jgi:hypothetical protein